MNELDELVIETEQGLFLDSRKFVESFSIDVASEHYDFLLKQKHLGHVELLELASRLSYLDPDNLHMNLSFVDIAEAMIGDKEKHFMISSFRMSVMKNFLDSRPNEFDVHELFECNYKKSLGDQLEIVARKNDPKHIPDFWLKRKDKYIPVEIKLHEFRGAHLKQLQRYMDFYNCDNGIAVGKELRCSLPDNVKFINYEHLQEA